ncbi:MAG TPA: aconitase family protein [Polyangiaceae bacterium]|jgi:aconitate hydratase|nr:aconitase family protein [Polyangiaceae bacterium]
MPQKILVGRTEDARLEDDIVRVRVDQVILAREPNAVLREAADWGSGKSAVETAVAYDTRCVTGDSADESAGRAPQQVARSLVDSFLDSGLVIARAGIGFPSAVHLERFAAPARLAITDEPRLVSMGGAGMLTLLGSRSQIAGALCDGTIMVRPPRSVQILLSGKLRPFVCVRDLALELLRRGLRELIEAIDVRHGAPVVLEFAGPSARLISIPDRALLCSLAPRLGAIAGVFVSDERTEVYLRDQRRSKAHRPLVPDAGAPCDEVLTIDLSAVDPLLQDAKGEVRPVRELDGMPVQQAVLGGDLGAPLRDMLTATALLKSKRVPPELEFLVACASRQMLEVLARANALVDLIATGARLVEPDSRVLSGQLYPPPAGGLSLRTYDPEPGRAEQGFVVASAETLAYAVATGQIGDPRSFKRPVRVTVPRELPTEDVLIVRQPRSKSKKAESVAEPGARAPQPRAAAWHEELPLGVVTRPSVPSGPSAFVTENLEELGWYAGRASALAPALRVIVAPFVPSGWVTLFSACGVLSLQADQRQLSTLQKAARLTVLSPERWQEHVPVSVDGETLELRWAAKPRERQWAVSGSPLGGA